MDKVITGETQLYPIGTQPKEHLIDVVFVHGLGGNYQTTWMLEQDRARSWPIWLAEDLPEARVWCAQYPAAPSGWVGRNLRTLAASTSLLDRMDLNRLGEKPIVFVCHSLGGLVTKQLLRTAFDLTATPEWRRIARATKGVVFLGTPHTGAGLANLIANFAKALWLVGSLLRVTDLLTELQRNSDLLEDLGDWYRSAVLHHKIATLVYTEGHPVNGAVWVVPRGEANPGIPNVKPIELGYDHFELCKPVDRAQGVYPGTLEFIRRRIRKTQTTTKTKKKAPASSPDLTPIAGPKLELSLVMPTTAVRIPKLIKGPEPVVARVDAAASQMGLMSRDWAREILSRQSDGEAANSNQKEIAYAEKLAEWYRSALMSAMMQLTEDTKVARVVGLYLQLSNAGTQPAEYPEIELWTNPPRNLDSSLPSRSVWRIFQTEAPVPPDDIGLPLPTARRRPEIRYYDLPASASYNSELEHVSVTNVKKGHASLIFRASSLQHGKAISFAPIYLLIGDEPAEDVVMRYKLFARNQPLIGEGAFPIHLVD